MSYRTLLRGGEPAHISPFGNVDATSATSEADRAYLALLASEEVGRIPPIEREATGLRVAILERSQVAADFHVARLQQLGVAENEIEAISDFPDGDGLSDRLAAILNHADSLACASRQGAPGRIALMRAAGLDELDVVSISRLISGLSFQIRLVATIRALDQVA